MQIDLTTFVLELINFIVLVWLLHRFLYRPIQSVMARRRQAIENSVNEAASQKKEAEDLRLSYEKRLADWQREQDRERAQLDKELAEQRDRGLEEVRQAVEEEKQRLAALNAKKEADAQHRLEKRALDQGMAFAAKFLERLSGEELDAKLAELLISDMESWPADRQDTLKAALADADGKLTIRSARELSSGLKDRLSAVFSDLLGKACNPQFSVDETLVAGLSVAVGPWALQANVKSELAFFAEGMVHAD